MEKLQAYELFKNSSWEDDGRLIDYEFDSLLDVLDTFDFELTKAQKEKIGEFLLNKHEEDLEDYQEHLYKCAHESMEEDEAREHYYEAKGGE
jgi:hypothetical protein